MKTIALDQDSRIHRASVSEMVQLYTNLHCGEFGPIRDEVGLDAENGTRQRGSTDAENRHQYVRECRSKIHDLGWIGDKEVRRRRRRRRKVNEVLECRCHAMRMSQSECHNQQIRWVSTKRTINDIWIDQSKCVHDRSSSNTILLDFAEYFQFQPFLPHGSSGLIDRLSDCSVA